MSGYNTGAVLEGKVTERGTTNSNVRGSSYDRRKRKEWLLEHYRADVYVIRVYWPSTNTWTEHLWSVGLASMADTYEKLPTCRCFHCGLPLTIHTVTVDRIIPGCHGGTYRRNNIRPACGQHNSELGGGLRRKK